jgi:hypothetical protein
VLDRGLRSGDLDDNYYLRRIHPGGDRLYSNQGQPGD